MSSEDAGGGLVEGLFEVATGGLGTFVRVARFVVDVGEAGKAEAKRKEEGRAEERRRRVIKNLNSSRSIDPDDDDAWEGR